MAGETSELDLGVMFARNHILLSQVENARAHPVWALSQFCTVYVADASQGADATSRECIPGQCRARCASEDRPHWQRLRKQDGVKREHPCELRQRYKHVEYVMHAGECSHDTFTACT